MHSLDSNSNIPGFILKLWKLVNNESTNDLICWSKNGRSFIIKDQGRFAKELLPLYFKHGNMASFIRQLNMYGFRKLTNIDNAGLKSEGDEVEFFHPHFSQGKEDQLQYIKRKMTNTKSLATIVKTDEIQDILADVESIKGRQDSVDILLHDLKQENEALWREIAILRQKHIKQQQIVEKLLQFLVSIVRVGGIKRKAPLLLDANNHKIIKNKDGNAIIISPPSSSSANNSNNNNNNGPIIHEIADAEEQNQNLNNAYSPASADNNQYINVTQITLDSNDMKKSPQPLQQEDQSGLVPASMAPMVNVVENQQQQQQQQKDTLAASLPDLLEFDFNQIQNNDYNNDGNFLSRQQPIQQNYNNNLNILNTSRMNLDEASIADLMKSNNQQSHDSSANIAVPSKSLKTPEKIHNASSSVGSDSSNRMTKLTSENFTDHIEGIDTELNWLQDQLYGGGLNIDPNTIVGLFTPEQHQFINDTLNDNSSTSDTVPKAITDGLHDQDNRLIKLEDNTDSQDLFEGLDLNNIGNDKDILSDFNVDIDSSNFN